jgi:hypothetical protein
MGGPTPGYSVIRFDLPDGADFLGIEAGPGRPMRVADDGKNWHLAQGAFVVNAATFDLEAYRVISSGTVPRRTVVRAEGSTLLDEANVGPDGPFRHTASRPRAGLPPGSYYAIGFGSDGDPRFPNAPWYFDVRVSGRHACTPIGNAQIFDVDHTRFEGGTQIYSHGVGYAEGIGYTMDVPASTDIVVGLMDAAVQAAGEAELRYEMPGGSGDVDDEIEAFVSVAGEHRFEADFHGSFPLILVAGVAVDLP